MPDDLDFVFRPIPRFMSYWEAVHEWGRFDLWDVRMMNHVLDVEAENVARQHEAVRNKSGGGR